MPSSPAGRRLSRALLCWALFCSFTFAYFFSCSDVTLTCAAPAPAVRTHCGPVQGFWEQGAAVFRGIPYGKSPVGDRRWRSSLPLEKDDGCWTETLSGTRFGNVCMQMNVSTQIGDEDCLFVNVITYNHLRQSSGGLLPVAVWLHGGYLMYGSGGEPEGYAPNPAFAKNTGVVAVSFNYRLNVFGFLSLDVLSKGSGSGNYGFYDQILALKWVERNIEAFGGDKNQVTIYGQSSGGTSVVALLSSPLARGLFHGAVMMSASTTINASLAEADRANQVFLNATGCTTAGCLRALSAEKMLSITPFKSYPYWNGADAFELPTLGFLVGPVIVVDGVVIPEPSLHVIAAGKGNDVPVVVGTTGQEVDLQPPAHVRNASWSQYDAYVKRHMDTFEKDPAANSTDVYAAVSRLYPHDFAAPPSGNTCVTGTPEYLLTSMVADIRVTCPSVLLAQYYAKHFRSPVYNYVAVQCPSATAREYGARYSYHSWDANALFNLSFPPKPDFRPSALDWELVTTVQAWFRRFARGDSPHPQWKTVTSGTFSLIYEPEMRDLYHKGQCEFFNRHGFAPYRWQN